MTLKRILTAVGLAAVALQLAACCGECHAWGPPAPPRPPLPAAPPPPPGS